MQCTNISCYSKCKAYCVNYITSFSIFWAFVSPCPFFPSTSHYKPFSFLALSTIAFLSCCLLPIYTALNALFTKTHLLAIHPNTLGASLHIPITCTHPLSEVMPPHFLSSSHKNIRQTQLNILNVKKKKKIKIESNSVWSCLAPGILLSTTHTTNKYQENTIPLLILKYFEAVPISYIFSAT